MGRQRRERPPTGGAQRGGDAEPVDLLDAGLTDRPLPDPVPHHRHHPLALRLGQELGVGEPVRDRRTAPGDDRDADGERPGPRAAADLVHPGDRHVPPVPQPGLHVEGRCHLAHGSCGQIQLPCTGQVRSEMSGAAPRPG
jgi:hypothetical protein